MKSSFEEAYSNVRFNPSIDKNKVFLYYENNKKLVMVKLSQIQEKIDDLLLIRKNDGKIVEIPTHRVRVIRHGDQILLDRRKSFSGDPSID